MRLYLSSHRLGDRAGSLLALLGNGRRCAVVSDGVKAAESAVAGLSHAEPVDPVADLAGLGILAEHLDLTRYAGQPEQLRARLLAFDLVWVTGSSSLRLRAAMARSGFDDVIVDLLEADALVYAGDAAGAAVAAPALDGLHLMDAPDVCAADYASEPVRDGLGLIDHAIVPHYRAAGPRGIAAERVVRHLSARGQRYRALRDGEVIVWTESRRRPALASLRIAG